MVVITLQSSLSHLANRPVKSQYFPCGFARPNTFSSKRKRQPHFHLHHHSTKTGLEIAIGDHSSPSGLKLHHIRHFYYLNLYRSLLLLHLAQPLSPTGFLLSLMNSLLLNRRLSCRHLLFMVTCCCQIMTPFFWVVGR